MMRSIVAGILLVACCRHLQSQVYLEPTKEPVAVRPPIQLLQDLTSINGYSGFGDKISAEKQVAALSELGIDAKFAEDARLLFEDLDGDGKTEALLTVDIDGSDLVLVVLKRKGDQWYRLSPQPEFSCWCKYESAPLDTFVEVVNWSYSFEKAILPRRLILVRGSGGGTGLYERSLDIFALEGFRVRHVFETTEERRECPWPEGNCEWDHVITFERKAEPRMLVTYKVHISERPDRLGGEEIWWVGIPAASCKAYIWDTKEFKFMESSSANIRSCRPMRRTTPRSSDHH